MRTVLDTLKTPRSLLIAVSVSAFVFSLAVWLPNLRLLFIVATGTTLFADKIALPFSLLASIATNFTTLSAVSITSVAVLAGVNAALIAELMRTRQVLTGGAVAGVSGIALGALSVGCAACGSLILTTLVGTVLGASAIALLPLGGSEFGIIGVLLLGYATYLLSKQITKTTC